MSILSSALKQVLLKGIDRFWPRYMGKLKGSEYYAKVDVKTECASIFPEMTLSINS